MKPLHLLPLFVCLLLAAASPLHATEQFAAETGKACSVCHLDPAGGGELTATGHAYQQFRQGPQAAAPTPQKSWLRLVAGYLHLLFALFWFGTILYVHLVLKPAYAAGGLPRGEVRVGLLSMLVMAVTGAILTAYRVPSLEFLVSTRFGILLIIKIALFAVMVLSALFVVIFIGPRLRRGLQAAKQPVDPTGDLTPEQLAACDGQEGRASCFAYQGTVFNASNSRLWAGGSHFKRHQAGTDLSEALAQAPHGPEVFERIETSGRLLPAASGRPLHQKVFYAMAYMNLAFVFLITLIIALWRWG